MGIRIFTILMIFISSNLFCANNIIVEYYTGGQGSISLQNTISSVKYEMVLKGKSDFTTLMAKVTKKGLPSKQYELKDIKKDFTWALPARDGKGEYSVTLYGLLPNGRTYKGIARFSFTSTEDYPKLLIDEAAERMYYYSAANNKFKMIPPPLKTDSTLQLKGMNKFKTIMVQIAKPGKAQRQIRFNKNESTNFNYQYMLKDGPGIYTISIYGNDSGGIDFSGLATFTITATSNFTPDLTNTIMNDKVLAFALSVTNKTVGRGECWDLAADALDMHNADWARPFAFGQRIDPTKEVILPGDIIQMYSLKLVSKLPNGSIRTEYFGLPQHTSVVEKVVSPNVYLMLNQNVEGKRFVVRSILDLNNLASGKIEFYRPQAGLIKID